MDLSQLSPTYPYQEENEYKIYKGKLSNLASHGPNYIGDMQKIISVLDNKAFGENMTKH